MTGISSVQQIVATIRAEMAARVGATAPGAGAPAGRSTKSQPAVQARQQRMGKLIGERVKSLDPDDPQRGRKAFRIFLESVLLNEFGEDLINDHAFYQMIDAVEQAMGQDPQLSAAIQDAVAGLLNARPEQKP